MKRRHLYGATFEPEAPPEWAACRQDRYGGWWMVLFPLFVRSAAKSFEALGDVAREAAEGVRTFGAAWTELEFEEAP